MLRGGAGPVRRRCGAAPAAPVRSRRRSSTRTRSPGRTRRPGPRPRRFGRGARDQDPALLERGGARAAPARASPPADPTRPGLQLVAASTPSSATSAAHGLSRSSTSRALRAWAFERIDGAVRPDPGDYRAFALAAVRRYSGHFEGLPRVRFWQAWNEPNKVPRPRRQAGHGRVVPDARERVCGERPLGARETRSSPAVSRRSGSRPRSRHSSSCAACSASRRVTRLPRPATTPLISTSGRPTRTRPAARPTSRRQPGDVSVAELPEMKAVLDAGARVGQRRAAAPARVLGDGVLLGQRPARPGRRPGGARRALGGRGPLRHVELGRQPRHLVHACATSRSRRAPTRRASSTRRDASPTTGRSPRSRRSASRSSRFPTGKQIAVWGRTPAGRAGIVRIEQHGPVGWTLGRQARGGPRRDLLRQADHQRKRGPCARRFPRTGQPRPRCRSAS